jgi:hypothetical protein
LPKPLGDWLKTVAELALSKDPNLNMVAFSAVHARRAGVRADRLAAFLGAAFREYSRKASRARLKGWFYTWFDEMSDTLRCSLCDAASAADLPFRCKLNIVSDPAQVAELALLPKNDRNLHWEQFRPVVWDYEQQDVTAFDQILFARYTVTTE